MRRLGIALTALIVCPLLSAAQERAQTVRLNDKSDWWSILNENAKSSDSKTSDKEIAAANFEIAGVTLDDDRSFNAVQKKLGSAVRSERGDASTGRDQICYISTAGPKTYLIFEQGEMSLAFYLFAGGRHWNGEDLCRKSGQLTRPLGTKTGLRLGISRTDLEMILGKPDSVDGERLIYSRDIKKKTSTADLVRWRKEHPEMNEKKFHENYDFYDLGVYIEARFTNSRLSYLAVSKVESY